MSNQIANLGIIVKDFNKIPEVNALLHQYSDNIISRSGMPYKERNVRLISVILDSNAQAAAELNNKLDAINGINSQLMTFDL